MIALKTGKLVLLPLLLILTFYCAQAQTISIDGNAGGKRFDGIGAVSGGGATSVLLKDYPEKQRGQVLDLLFKPKFGASISALLVEIPGDGNSTQGTEPSHEHFKGDENYYRGYEWWLMKEAKKRNPDLTLDANAWSCPKWIGNNNFWSQDMCDYDASWIKGLKTIYGLDLDAIGCRNEKGVNEGFVKKLRATLNANGFDAVKIHGFDNWDKTKFYWARDMRSDTVLRNSVDIISAHTMFEAPAPADIVKLSEDFHKPIWNSEEHIYKDGFDCEISLVEAFNNNYIVSGVTKIVNWYLVGSVYENEPYAEKPAMMVAREPWSGNYYTRTVLWGYAHYGQFCKVGWQYLNGACAKLPGGGSYVTLRSPDNDFSIIAETKTAKTVQKLNFKISGGLKSGKLCVWRSNATEQFVRVADINPAKGEFSIDLEPQCIYSISTTRGQQKGGYNDIPASQPFPIPYTDDFESYKKPAEYGYLPRYTADIAGVFEIADRPDHKGQCLQQVIPAGAQSWAPEWQPYTIIGDPNWTDYDVQADILLNHNNWAGLMGRVSGTGYGYGSKPAAYYFSLAADGTCALYLSKQDEKIKSGIELASAKISNLNPALWHKVKLSFQGKMISAYVDDVRVFYVMNDAIKKGSTGFICGSKNNDNNLAWFDNLIISPIGGSQTVAAVKKTRPIYQDDIK